MNANSVRAAVLVSISGVASGAAAQCEPTWDTTLGIPGINTGYIEPIIEWNDGSGIKLFVGGSATDIGGGAANDFLAQYDPATENWSRVGLGISAGNTNAFLTKLQPWDDGQGEKLYAAGFFFSAGGIAGTKSLAAWDGSNWSALPTNFPSNSANAVYDLLPASLGGGDEKLYICGNFPTIGMLPAASGIAAWDGEAFETVGTGDGIAPFGGFNPFVASLIVWDDGSGDKLYACGRFNGIDTALSNSVARFNPTTGLWEPIGGGIIPTSTTGNMTSWAIFDDGNGEALYLGGQTFRVAGDSQVYVVAKWDGSQWTGIGQTLSGRVTDLKVWDDGSGPALYLSGTATFEVNYFAKLENGLWVPAQSGINNPPNSGNFASAFGLGTFGDQLVVGGNFTQVGGFDPVTGVGTGTPLPASGLAALSPCVASCPADLTGSADPNDPTYGVPDGDADADDFFFYLDAFVAGDLGVCDFTGSSDPNDPSFGTPDGDCDADDFFFYLDLFVAGCS
ncbi:MAG: GC-type dockerin domain-anchored protein [Phycisphaerales bacterium JB037]